MFAIIYDWAPKNTYKKYQYNNPMMVCRPSQIKLDSTQNNFMNLSTRAIGIDGVIEILNSYIESIRSLTLLQVFDTQKQIIAYMTTFELIDKIINRDFAFLEQYLKVNLASLEDYNTLLHMLKSAIKDTTPTKEELTYLQNMLELLSKHFKENDKQRSIKKILKLKKYLKKVRH